MLLSQLHLSTSCLWSQPPQSHHEAGRGGIAAGLGHQEVQWPVTLVMGPVESWQFPRDLWSLANGHSLFILQEKRWIKFFCTGQWKRERATCVDGLPWVWGGKKSPLASPLGLQHIFLPWLKRQIDSPSRALRNEPLWALLCGTTVTCSGCSGKAQQGWERCYLSLGLLLCRKLHSHITATSKLGSPRRDNSSQMSLVKCQVMIMCVANPISSTNLYCMLLSHVTVLFRGQSRFNLISKLVENICSDL